MRALSFTTLLAVALTACSKKEDSGLRFDGQYFAAKSKKVDDTLSVFTVTVEPVSSSLDGALAAGGYEGTRYCIKNFGTSVIKWTVGPKTEPGQLRIVEDTLTLQGQCDP
ncbi:MAG: hypothetical protein JKY94_02940 [Rhodobacteraceae bacterium]|nr:hypothetical protein [Paracoccaceae bacterium]